MITLLGGGQREVAKLQNPHKLPILLLELLGQKVAALHREPQAYKKKRQRLIREVNKVDTAKLHCTREGNQALH